MLRNPIISASKCFCRAKEQARHCDNKGSPNCDIFAELLGENSHSSDSHKQSGPSLSNDHNCSEDHVIHWEPGLQNVAMSTDHILTCSGTAADIRLTIYPWIQQNDFGKREVASTFSHQILMPCNYSREGVTSLLYVLPTLSCYAIAGLDQQFFSLLFGRQLGNTCPAIIVGFHSGLVGYIQVGASNPKLETLYHLEQPVLFITPLTLNPPSPKGVNLDSASVGDALCMVGTLGKLVLISYNHLKSFSNQILTQEYHIPGPVVCMAVNNGLDTLFYSTLKDIYALEFKTNSKDRNASDIPLPTSLSPKSLDIPKVLALTVDNEGSLILYKKDGRVMIVAQPLVERMSRANLSDGDVIKKHLEEIHEKTSQVKCLREEIRQLDELIKHLNRVTQVMCKIMRNREPQSQTNSQESVINFNVRVDYEDQGTSSNPRVILRCQLTNATMFPFSSSWSFVVQAHTSQPWCNEDCSVEATKSHSACLSPATSHHISIAMEDTCSYLTPIQVSCFVCFHVDNVLPVFLKDREPSLREEGFSVLVSKKTLNILNFLRKQETCPTLIHSPRNPIHLVQSILQDSSVTFVPEVSDEVHLEKSREFSTLSIQLSKEAVDFIGTNVQEILRSKNTTFEEKSKPNHEGSKPSFVSKEECLLHFILDGSGRYLHSSDMKYCGGQIVTRTPNEDVVKFQVMDCVPKTQGFEGCEVRVHSSSKSVSSAVQSSLLALFKVGLDCFCLLMELCP